MNIRHLTIFWLSFIILSLQIILSLLLDAVAYLPFFAVSFAFLGLTLAGVNIYIRQESPRYDRKDSIRTWARQLLIGGAHIIVSLAVLYFYNAFVFDLFDSFGPVEQQTLFSYFKLHIFCCSILSGLLFSVSFFQFGSVVCALYKESSENSPQVYLFDLCGAALGCVFAVIILNILQIGSALIVLALAAFGLSWFLGRKIDGGSRRFQRTVPAVFGACFIFLCVNMLTGVAEIKLNPDIMTGIKQSEELWARWNIYSRTALVRSPAGEAGRFNYNFVLNFNSGKARLVPFNPKDPFALKLYEGFSPVMLAFLTQEPRDVLVLFTGTGKDMVEAYSYSRGKANITGVELNPLMVRKALSMPELHLREFFEKDNVRMVVQEGRSFLEQSRQKYDSIILSWSGATVSSHLGTSSYTGQYLYTKEAMKAYLEHLNPQGVVGIVHGSSRLLATVKAAFDELGYSNPEDHIIEMLKGSDIARFQGGTRSGTRFRGGFF